MKNLAIYKVNDKALNNGLQTIYVEIIAIFTKHLKEVTLSDIQDDAGLAHGCKVHVLLSGNVTDISGPPESIIHIIGEDVFVVKDNYNYHLNPKLDYSAISDTKQIAKIEKSVVQAAYVTSSETIAKGEWTVVFAQPNAGKTLIVLSTVVEQIINGVINGEDVFYFNLDDARPAYLEKLKILKPLNFVVLDADPASVMDNLIKNRQAKDKIVIIDTLIRVCDTNSRPEILDLSALCKSFCEQGGTVITLAHANKHLDNKTGEPILEGQGLLRNNAHCVSYLQKFDDIIKMVNIKKRTIVKDEVIFQIDKDLPYPELFDSVRTLTGDQATQLFQDRERNQLAQDHATIVETIKETIISGIDHRTDLAKVVYDNTGDYKKTIYNVLDELEGKLWKMTRGPTNNSKVYSVI
jgi:archaellum biogenesis ATPase FlaH